MLSAVALFCEDIREEKAGSDTLIGIYPDNVNVPAIPCALPKLSIYLRIHIDPKSDLQSVSLRIRMPNGREPLSTEFDPELIDKARSDAKKSGAPLVGFYLTDGRREFSNTHAGKNSCHRKNRRARDFSRGVKHSSKRFDLTEIRRRLKSQI